MYRHECCDYSFNSEVSDAFFKVKSFSQDTGESSDLQDSSFALWLILVI